MSENFTGITFAKQKVAPSDDAIIRRAILPDGILTGCAISYSGSTLTMAAGQLLICGRQIRHPAAQNWAVVDATSGFARLLLTIDLTRTSTKEVFDQVVDTIEYAAAEDGFPDLEQTDINAAGTRYQVAACVVSLGTGGITGIVSQLPLSRAEGGDGLNFSVVGGVTQPNDPKENTIWVNTDNKITGYYFQAEQPENMAEGEVWIITGTVSTVAFNAAKKNVVMVYPLSAKQMVGGALVNVEAKSWQNGEWVEWWNGILYKNGKFQNVLENGFEVIEGNVKVSYEPDRFIYSSASNNGAISSPEKINVTGHKTVSLIGRVNFNTGAPTEYRAGLTTEKNSTSFVSVVNIPISTTDIKSFTIEIPKDGGEFYLVLTCGGGGNNSNMYVDVREIVLN